MKLTATALALTAAVLGLLSNGAVAQACPTLRVTTRAPKVVRNNRLISVAISAKNVGTTPAGNVTISMTLPAGVLCKSQRGHPKTSAASFVQNGQELTWSGIALSKRGAAQTLRLKVNVTNCADGQLAFTAATTVGGVCPLTGTPATATVKHKKGWVPCAPSEACSIPVSGYPNVYACGPDIEVCAFDGNFDNNMPTLDGCFAFCQMTTPGAIFVEYSPSGQVCSCITNIEGVLPYNPSVDLYAIGQPRTPSGTPGDCGGRRLNADNSLYGV